MGIISLSGETKEDPFIIVSKEDGISIFLEKGGLTLIAINREKEKREIIERQYKKDELLDLDIRLKKFESKIGRKLIIAGFIITFLSFLISILTQRIF